MKTHLVDATGALGAHRTADGTPPTAHLLSQLTPAARALFTSMWSPLDATALDDEDWDALLPLAEREKATIALHKALRAGASRTPHAGARAIAQAAAVLDFRMGYLEDQWSATAAAFEAHGVPAMALKGAAIVRRYGLRFVDRPMLDLDVLVPAAAVPAAIEAARSCGWAPVEDSMQVRTPIGHHHLPPLVDGRGLPLSLELHTELLPPQNPFVLKVEELWATAGTRQEGGTRLPDVHHLAWHSCVHFAWSHLFRIGAWRTVADVRRLTGDPEFSWDRFVALCQASGAASCAYWTLRIAEGLGGVAVPPGALDRLRPRQGWVPESMLERHILSSLFPGPRDCPSARVRRLGWSLAIAPRWSGHGTRRPWSGAPAGAANVLPTGGSVEHRAAWRSYLRTILGYTPTDKAGAAVK